MSLSFLQEVFGVCKPVIGMTHLLPLPGAPRYDAAKGFEAILSRALGDMEALVSGGVDAVMFCNEGDVPYAQRVGPETVASMTSIIERTVSRFRNIPYGVSVLFDPFSTIAIAKAVEAKFIRVIASGAFAGDLGVMNTFGAKLLRYRKYIDAEKVKLFTNICGEFGAPIAPRPIELAAKGAFLLGLADAIIVQGPMAGMKPSIEDVVAVKKALPHVPVFVGTGVDKENVIDYLGKADGVIVGTSLKVGGVTWNPVDEGRVKKFMKIVKGLR